MRAKLPSVRNARQSTHDRSPRPAFPDCRLKVKAAGGGGGQGWRGRAAGGGGGLTGWCEGEGGFGARASLCASIYRRVCVRGAYCRCVCVLFCSNAKMALASSAMGLFSE